MEASLKSFFQSKKCITHNQQCVAIRLNGQSNLNDKILCISCFSQNQNINKASIEDVVQTVIEMQSIKSEEQEKLYGNTATTFKSYSEEINKLKDFSVKKLEEMSNSVGNILKEVNGQLIDYNNINDEEINKILNLGMNLSVQQYSQSIINEKQIILMNIQDLTSQHQKLTDLINTFCKAVQITIATLQNWKPQHSMEIQPQIQQFNFQNRLQSIQQRNQASQQSSQIKKKQYEQQIQFQIEQQKFLSLAINKNNNILIGGGNPQIYAYQIVNYQEFVLKQTLGGHNNQVSCLLFCQNSNNFVSGSADTTVRVWIETAQMYWQCRFLFKEHQYNITGILMSKNEDELISSSYDTTVKIRLYGNNSVQEIKTNDFNCQMDYNSNQSQIILRSQNLLSLLQKNQSNNKWEIKQQINNIHEGFYACFIQDTCIASQNYKENENFITLYKQNQENNLFQEHQIIPLEKYLNSLPICNLIYNKQKRLLIAKSDNYINIIQIDPQLNPNNNVIIQKIQINNPKSLHIISNDGEYLLINEHQNNLLKVLKCIEN